MHGLCICALHICYRGYTVGSRTRYSIAARTVRKLGLFTASWFTSRAEPEVRDGPHHAAWQPKSALWLDTAACTV
jgi:hypothetical protein